MGLFEGDIYVILKPRKEWETARTQEELVEAFDSALAEIPGLWVVFSQPLRDRLDEAERGIRTHLGVKVIGPDLEQNQESAEGIAKIRGSVRGAADVGDAGSEGDGEV